MMRDKSKYIRYISKLFDHYESIDYLSSFTRQHFGILRNEIVVLRHKTAENATLVWRNQPPRVKRNAGRPGMK